MRPRTGRFVSLELRLDNHDEQVSSKFQTGPQSRSQHLFFGEIGNELIESSTVDFIGHDELDAHSLKVAESHYAINLKRGDGSELDVDGGVRRQFLIVKKQTVNT